MRRNSTSSVGAFHPVIFFTLVYGISLFLALFVCRTVYQTLNPETENTSSLLEQAKSPVAANATAYR